MYLSGWLAWPVQDGYDNEGGDDSLSGQRLRVTRWNKIYITHTVPFKSIGTANEKKYQHPLEKAYVNLHEHNKPVNVVNSN